MYKAFIALLAVILVGGTVWFALDNIRTQEAAIVVPETTTNPDTTPQPQECHQDAKICPDGSSVGRTGPNCEFAACPSHAATSATLTTYLGGTATGLNISVTPNKIVSDSRCPKDVQCIWAGTVEVRTVIASQVAHGEHTLKLGEPQVFGEFTVTLTKVTPEKGSETIPGSSYRFTFEVKKN
jgi:hypothetical protein